MFTPIAEDVKEELDKRGYLHLRVDPANDGVDPDFKHVPHIISYVNNRQGGYPHSLFSCKITHTDKMFIMSDLCIDVDGFKPAMDEPALHMFLEWTCFEAQNWAKSAHKERLMIETNLPHISEHFLNYGYDIRQYWAKGTERGYRGLKRVKDA